MTTTRRLALVLLAALALAACGEDSNGGGDGGGGGSAGDGDKVKVALILPSSANDSAWDQGHLEGAQALERAGEIELEWIDDVGQDGAAFSRVAEQYARQGSELIIGGSFNFGKPMERLAQRYEDVDWAWPGGVKGTAENIADYDQPFYQAAYVGGIAAAGVTKTNMLGGLAGFDIPVCHSMLEAFKLGAQSVNPEIKLLTTYNGTWYDPAKERAATLAQADRGADVFIACGVPTGVIEAAKERDLAAIGYVIDQSPLAPRNVLGSVVWNLEVVFRTMVDDVKQGSFRPGSYYQIGLGEKGVLFELNPKFKDPVPKPIRERMREAEQQIESGKLEVPYVPK